MIVPGKLSRQQQLNSQRQLHYFNAANGLSYMCLGETVIILFAVQLGCADYIVSSLGAMIYFGFITLPLGKITAGSIGAARSQSLFWILRCGAALLVALSAVINAVEGKTAAVVVLLIGAFLFYAFRSAGTVMINPLIGNITEVKDRPRFLGENSGIFYAFALLALLLICGLLALNSSLWMLTAIIAAGSGIGIFSSGFLRKIDESESLRQAARHPMGKLLWGAWREKALKQQLAAMFTFNLSVILTAPISMLVLKRGFHVSDMDALLYSAVQFGASAVMSFAVGRLSGKLGAWKVAVGSYFCFTVIALCWVLFPLNTPWYCLIAPFFLAGGSFVAYGNALANYLLNQIPENKRLPASILLAVIGGAGAGAVGMVLSGGLLKLFGRFNTPEAPLNGYRMYFAVVAVLMIGGWFVVRKLDRKI